MVLDRKCFHDFFSFNSVFPQQTDFLKLNLIYISAHGFIQTDICLQVDLTQ